jgi:DNA-binding MarR family transcriptional regulator
MFLGNHSTMGGGPCQYGFMETFQSACFLIHCRRKQLGPSQGADMASTPDHTLKNHIAAGPVIAEIMALLPQVTEQFEPEHSQTRQWMVQHCPNPVIVDLLQDSTLLMLQVLDAIGRLELVNGITISKRFRIPKGSVSKATRRLIAKKLIKQEYLPNNKKEVLFRLTPLGRELFDVHRAFDQQMERGFVQFLQKYDANDLRFLVRVLQDTLEVSFLDLGAHPES